MKQTLFMGIAGVIGLILGVWWPQSDLRLARNQIDEMKQELASRSKRAMIPEMARMIAMPDPRAGRASVDSTPLDSNPNAVPARRTPTPHPLYTGEPDNAERKPDPGEQFAEEMSRAFEESDSAEDALETMADLWHTRQDLARKSLVDKLGLSDTELADFDAAMEEMNDALGHRFEDFADRFEAFSENQEPSPEDAFRMAHDFTGVFVDTYDAMDDTLPYGWREDTPDLDLTAFIDPYIFKPLLDLDDEWTGP
ncbi:hypothetical protein JXA80_06780 [bacterium]|nr:hypothetical protein [candidate division CSSED10-310 bacterium]